jgi:hypothetical protein
VVGPPLSPVADVMTLTERNAAAREPAASVAVMQRAPERRWDGPRPRFDFHDSPIRIVSHHHASRVARQAAGRFRGNVRTALEDGLAGRVRVRQHGRVDVDDNLVALARRAGIDPVVQRGLREQRQRVRLLLSHRGRFRGNVLRARSRVQSLARRGQRLHEHGARLGREPPTDDDHAVFVLIHV